jgi:hypothetical protein
MTIGRTKDKDKEKDKKELDTTQSPEPFTFLTSKTRKLGFQFSRIPTAFYTWNDCAYRVKQVKYRRGTRPASCRPRRVVLAMG